jgi:WD40 repeat protein
VTGSVDNTARLWSAETGIELHVLKGHEDWIKSVAFSPDGKLVVTGSDDKTAWLWNAETGRKLRVLKGHTGAVNSVAFSSDSRLVVTGSGDNTAWLWNAETGSKQLVLKGHKGAVNSVAFNPDGKRVMTGSNDDTVRVWNISTGSAIVFDGHLGNISSLALSGDGAHIATTSLDRTTCLWRIPEPAAAQIVSLQPPERLYSLALGSRPNEWFAGSVNGRLLHFDGAELSTWADVDRSIYAVAGDQTGRWLAFGQERGSVGLIEIPSKSTTLSWIKAPFSVYGLEFNDKATRIIVGYGGYDGTGETGGVMMLGVPDGKEIFTVDLKTVVVDVDFSPNQKQFLAAGADGVVRLFKTDNGELIRSFSPATRDSQIPCYTARFSPDGTRVAAAFGDGVVRIWNAADQSLVGEFKASLKEALGVDWVDRDRFFSTGFDKTVRFFSLKSPNPLAVIDLPSKPFLPTFDGRNLLVPTAKDGIYRVEVPPYRSWEELLEAATDRAGGRAPTAGDAKRIELLPALTKH